MGRWDWIIVCVPLPIVLIVGIKSRKKYVRGSGAISRRRSRRDVKNREKHRL